MRHFWEHTRHFPRQLALAARKIRLGDPLTQVWLLTGGVLLSGVLLRDPENGSRNPERATIFGNGGTGIALLPRAAGVGPGWSDSFSPDIPESALARPPVVLPPLEEAEDDPAPVVVREPEMPEDELRGEMRKAARRPWRFLTREIRDAINALPQNGFSRLEISLSRSGASSGGARLLFWRGKAEREPADFVIGNGSHTADGAIEIGPGWRTRTDEASRRVRLCFIGEPGSPPTPAQRAAAGELLNYLEMRLGVVALASANH